MRDLKPDNVMLEEDGFVNLIDFGLAADLGNIDGEAAGTPEYVSPEILQKMPATEKADFWALGIIIFEMLVGFTPFIDSNGDFSKLLNNVLQ